MTRSRDTVAFFVLHRGAEEKEVRSSEGKRTAARGRSEEAGDRSTTTMTATTRTRIRREHAALVLEWRGCSIDRPNFATAGSRSKSTAAKSTRKIEVERSGQDRYRMRGTKKIETRDALSTTALFPKLSLALAASHFTCGEIVFPAVARFRFANGVSRDIAQRISAKRPPVFHLISRRATSIIGARKNQGRRRRWRQRLPHR